MSDSLTFTKLSEASNEAEWPDGEAVITWLVEGPLADRIRRAVGVEEKTRVTIEEIQEDGGWSEWTQETNYSFMLLVGGRVIDFGLSPLQSLWDTLEAPYGRETAIGKLSRWLDAAESKDA